MPSLTEVIEQAAKPAVSGDCQRCQKRKAQVVVAGTCRHVHSRRLLRAVEGKPYCRTCANEVIEQIGQLLGVST